jgi:hypothetical protein
VKKLIVFAGGAVVAASASMGLFGVGVAAAAPDVVGQTYADASQAIDEAGDTAVVANTIGGRLPQDECIVTNAQDAPFIRDSDGEFGHADGEVLLALNCNGGYASAKNPGASVASPEGREAKAAADEAAASEQEALEDTSTPDE